MCSLANFVPIGQTPVSFLEHEPRWFVRLQYSRQEAASNSVPLDISF